MAHHPFPARLRIPTQNVGTGGIRGFQQADRVASFHSFARRGHTRLFCSEESESLPHGTSRRQGQTHLARRSDRHRDTPCPTGTEHRHLPENRMHYPLLHTFYIRSEAERQAPPPPRSAPVFFVPSACPCGSPRPQTPLTAPALRQGCCDSPHAALFRTVPPPRSVNPLAHRFKQQHGRGSRNVQRLDGPDDGYGQLHVAQFKNLL